MKFRSTRRSSPEVSFSQALQASLAPDGGLYVPSEFPKFTPEQWASWAGLSLSKTAEKVLAPFLKADALESKLGEIANSAFTFPTPLNRLDEHTSVLELFHGPTAAFKDVGARFLAESLARVARDVPTQDRTVLVATSGDTGGAVAAAFYGKAGFKVCILFPKGRISPLQQKQLCCWGGNVRAFAVQGDFDDCQRMVKEAFADPAFKDKRGLISANSISIGRLLPQTVYYIWASLTLWKRDGKAPSFIIPTGNLGNAVAAFWAKQMGFPLGSIILATNANRPIADFLASGTWTPHATRATLANAMDVGNPSNMERLRDLFADFSVLKREVRAVSVSDEQIQGAIRSERRTALCPHTATAAYVRKLLDQNDGTHWVLAATAHPAKFDSVVEPLIGRKVEIPQALQKLLEKPAQSTELAPTIEALKAELEL